MSSNKNTDDVLIPEIGVVKDIRRDTPDVKTFRVEKIEGGKNFEHLPGQCAMLSIPGIGEAMFSITSSPTVKDYLEFSIKKCGCLTNWLHKILIDQQITIRGPYGNGFPIKNQLIGEDLLFIAGGIGIAPLRSVINYVIDNRDDYGKVDIVYGARTSEDLVNLKEIKQEWTQKKNLNIHLTIDKEEEDWSGNVSFVPTYVKDLEFNNDKKVLVCGPPIMIKYVLLELQKLGFEKKQIFTTLELKMKCGVGKCGRCNIGSQYVCKDGPVFRYDELKELPEEY